MKILSSSSATILLATALTGCGGGGDKTVNDTQGNVAFRITLTTQWNQTDFPTRYPSSAHWSPPIGTVHNEQVVFWRADDQPASEGIEVMAETGGTSTFAAEIETAQASGYSQGQIRMSSISNGPGAASIEISTSDTYPLLSLTSMIAPSPDWFIGVDSLNLKPNGEWIDELTVQLPLYDAGTDTGLTFTSADEDSSAASLPITLVSTARSDSDFQNGVHFETGGYVATLTIERIGE